MIPKGDGTARSRWTDHLLDTLELLLFGVLVVLLVKDLVSLSGMLVFF